MNTEDLVNKFLWIQKCYAVRDTTKSYVAP